MCVDPITLTLIAGTAMSAVGSVQSASATSAADKANAAQLRAQSQATANSTTADIDNATNRFERQQGAVRNIIGNSGIAPSSFQAVLDDDSHESVLEKATIRTNGDMQRAQLATKANAEDAAAKSATTAGYIGAASAIIGGANSYAKLSNPNRTPYDNTYGGVTFNTAYE